VETSIERLFGVRAAGSTPAREARAALTTFLTMAYILFVNPSILGAAIKIDGIDLGPQLMTATALAAGIGCLLMGLIARHPFALAPGMGLNAYFAYTVVLGEGIPWQTALGAVLISGLVFLALSVVGVRELIVVALPGPLKQAISAGIGLFLAFIGLSAAGLVVDHPVTLVTLGPPTQGSALAMVGLLLTGGLMARRVKSAVLIGVVVVSVLAIAIGAPVFAGEAFSGLPGGSPISAPAWPVDIAGALDVPAALEMGLLGIVFIFLFVDFFDTAGTLVGLSRTSGIADEDGKLPRAAAAFSCDAIATAIGACLGTSTTTAYIESAAGIQAGGRTGLVAVLVGVMFLLSVFFWPLAAAVPAVATAPALVLVGALMLGSLKGIDWEDPVVAIPVFLTVAGIPLTFSIATGITLGVQAWLALSVISGRRVHWLLWVLSALMVLRFAWLGIE